MNKKITNLVDFFDLKGSIKTNKPFDIQAMEKQPKLKLIKQGAIKGYTISNIKEVLSKEQYQDFEKWIYGQTVGVYKGEDLIYAEDLYRFLKDLPSLD